MGLRKWLRGYGHWCSCKGLKFGSQHPHWGASGGTCTHTSHTCIINNKSLIFSKMLALHRDIAGNIWMCSHFGKGGKGTMPLVRAVCVAHGWPASPHIFVFFFFYRLFENLTSYTLITLPFHLPIPHSPMTLHPTEKEEGGESVLCFPYIHWSMDKLLVASAPKRGRVLSCLPTLETIN